MGELEVILLTAFPGSRIRTAAELAGGISSGATRYSVELPNGDEKHVVVRRPSARAPETGENTAPQEARALELARAAGVLAPRLEHFDTATNTLILEYVPGHSEFAPTDLDAMLQSLAEGLVSIHRVSAESFDLSFLSQRREGARSFIEDTPSSLDASLDEAGLRGKLRALWPWRDKNASVLLHGDYWPGNVLWKDGRIVAVIDWEEVDVGDPLADVAITRLDLAWAFGLDACEAFTRAYAALTDLDWSTLPCWDLVAALRPMSQLARWATAYSTPAINRPDIDEAHMRRVHQEFVRRALTRLDERG